MFTCWRKQAWSLVEVLRRDPGRVITGSLGWELELVADSGEEKAVGTMTHVVGMVVLVWLGDQRGNGGESWLQFFFLCKIREMINMAA
jgi:hypothetical protein